MKLDHENTVLITPHVLLLPALISTKKEASDRQNKNYMKLTERPYPLVVLCVLFFLPSIFCDEIKMHVVDDLGQNVSQAEVTIAFIGYIQGSGKTNNGSTDGNGDFKAKGSAAHSVFLVANKPCLLYTSPSPRDRTRSRMPSSA